MRRENKIALFGLEAEEYDRIYKDRDLYRRILRYFSPYYRALSIVIIFLTLTSLSNAFVPILSRMIINNLETTKNTFYLFLIIVITFILNIFAYVFNYFRQKYSATVVGNVVLDLRRDADTAVLERDLSFFDRNPIGKIVSRMNTDSRDFGDAMNLFMQFFSSILIIIIILAYMTTINLTLFLITISIIPLFIIIALPFRKAARKATLLG